MKAARAREGWVAGHLGRSYGRNSAYLPIVDLLKRAFGVEEGDDEAQIIRRVDEVVCGWEESAQKRAPYLKYLLSVDPGDESVTTMDPQERRIEIFEALGTLLVEESAGRPLVVVVEDLHWADQMSQEALGALMAVVPSAPVLLVLTHRPGYDRPSSDFTVLDLKHLDEEESVALTRGVLGVEALPPEVQRLVTAKAEGNPFYIEEVSKALVEAGVVARVNGSYQLQRPLEEVHVANADALGFYARAQEVCATLGDQALPASASLAARRGFVNFIVGDIPQAIADFDRMLAASRRLESRSLEGIALGYRGFLEVFNNDWERAEATLRTALAIVEEGCEDVRPVVNFGLVFLMFSANRLPEAEPLLINADQAAALPDPFLQGAWNWVLGFFQYWWGRPEEALQTLRGMSEAAARLVSNRLWNWWPQSLALATKGEYESALSLLHEMQATSERVGDVLIRPRVFNTLGWIYGELEDHERALEWNQASVEFVQSLPAFPNPDVEMHARLNVADNLMALDRPDDAEEQFRIVEAVARSPRPADRWMAWRYMQHLFHSYGELWLARGDTARALAYADQCLEVALYNSSAKNVIKGRRLRGQVFMAQGLTGVENVTGSNDDDTLVGNLAGNVISGADGNDHIDIQDGIGYDTAIGGAGTDTCLADRRDRVRSCES